MIASCALWRGPCQRATGGRREREMTRIYRWLEGRRGEEREDATIHVIRRRKEMIV